MWRARTVMSRAPSLASRTKKWAFIHPCHYHYHLYWCWKGLVLWSVVWRLTFLLYKIPITGKDSILVPSNHSVNRWIKLQRKHGRELWLKSSVLSVTLTLFPARWRRPRRSRGRRRRRRGASGPGWSWCGEWRARPRHMTGPLTARVSGKQPVQCNQKCQRALIFWIKKS